MFDLHQYLLSLSVISIFAFAGWILSSARNNVTHVDSLWSLFFALAAYTTYLTLDDPSTRAILILILVNIWALRLFAHLTIRNWGAPEDDRYVDIRKNNQPHFWLKSIYIVFGLQALLAWLISISLYGAIISKMPLNILDYLGALLFAFGLFWEVVSDWQLIQFKQDAINKGKVLDTGLWRYTRHPNYFGECCLWWGLYLIALAGGAWWAIISPILITILLLKVSGVSMLESTIGERRPDYAQYKKTTNAFLPWFKH